MIDLFTIASLVLVLLLALVVSPGKRVAGRWRNRRWVRALRRDPPTSSGDAGAKVLIPAADVSDYIVESSAVKGGLVVRRVVLHAMPVQHGSSNE
jgi:hypothetical protein